MFFFLDSDLVRPLRRLTPEENHVFSKGPNFYLPQARVNVSEIVFSVEVGIFGSRGIAENLDLLRAEVIRNVLDFTPYSSNSKNRETQFLKNLTKYPDITITRLDRGNEIFILDKISHNKKLRISYPTFTLINLMIQASSTRPPVKYEKS